MTASINRASPKQKRVLVVAANPSVSPVTGWPIGFWLAELVHPYWAFVSAGYAVEIVSPDGGKLVPDSYSDPADASGYAADDILSLGFLASPSHRALIEHTKSIEQVDPSQFDAVFLVGGQSPMITFVDNHALHRLVVAFDAAEKIVAAVCHATCVLLRARRDNGELLVHGKTWTGFANSEEQFSDSFVGRKIQPFWIEDEARKIAETNFIVHSRFQEFAVRDGRLVTGQQQFSGAAAARLVIEALGV